MTFGTDSSFVFCFRDAVSKTVSEMLFQKNCFRKTVSEKLSQRNCLRETVSKKLFPKCSFQKLFLNVVSERYFKNAISEMQSQKRYLRKINPRKSTSENQPPKSSKSMLSLGTPSESSRSSTDLVIIGGPHIRYKASSGASWFFR